MIKVENLTKKFKAQVALNGVSFSVSEGELFGVIGTNGAGKTTLIKVLSTLLLQTSGEAFINGLNVKSNEYEIRKIINVCPQESAVAPALTVKENLNFLAGIYKIENREQKINELVEAFSLTKVLNKKAKSLSGGYKKKLSIALALINQPKVLFLDEPTVALDVLAKRELLDLIKGLKGKMTIILTTHYLEEAESLCDRVAIIDQGNLVALDTPLKLIEKSCEKTFEDAFVKLIKEAKL